MAIHPVEDLERSLIESSPDAILLIDEAGRVLFANARVKALFGYEPSELIGQPVEVLVPQRLRDAHVGHRASFMASVSERQMGGGRELLGAGRDGTELPIEVDLCPVQTTRGALTAAFVRDASARRKEERALREAEERFRFAFDEAPIGVAIVALDGRFLRVDRALARIVGYSPEELTGLTFQAITHPEDLDADLEQRDKLARGEIAVTQFAKRYVHKNGSIVDVILRSASVRDRGGAPLYFVTQVEDVTERRRAEQALRRSEESLRQAQRVAHLGSWDWDLRTNEVVRSPEIFAIHGVEPTEEYTKSSFTRFAHPDDRDRVAAVVGRALREGGSFDVEYRIVRPDRSERIVVQQGEVLQENGRSVRLVATIHDVTERRRDERERENSLRWLAAVLEQSPVGLVLAHGRDGDRLEVNKRAQHMIGHPLERAGQYPDVLCTPEGQPVGRSELPSARALRGERLVDVEYLIPKEGGGGTPILVSAAPIIDRNKAVLGAVAAFQDITAVKELERLRAEWASVVAHDLRQPLTLISLSAQMLGRLVGDGKLRKPIERIRAAVNRLNRMVGDLMDLSRLEAHRLELVRQQVDVVSLARASVEQVALQAADRPFDVRVRGDVPHADADPDRVAQVMENLLTNAVKYGKPSTPIVVTVAPEGAAIAVSVTNTGRPLAREELSRMFERFHRDPTAKIGGIPGVGLGLYITRSLVEAHGGHIAAESTPDGVTTFRFTLPAASELARRPAPAGKSSAHL